MKSLRHTFLLYIPATLLLLLALIVLCDWQTAMPGPGELTKADDMALDQTDTDKAAGAEWISLFDGSSLAGWRYFRNTQDKPERWVIENGELAFKPGPWGLLPVVNSYLFGGGSRDLIYAAEKFSDFELRLEWKISAGGNSGIFYLVASEDDNTPWFKGLEMQVLDNEGHDDGKIITHRAGDLYDLMASAPETVKPPGQWNAVRIRVQGMQIEHWLNGTRVLSITRGSKDWQQRVAASKFKDYPSYGMARSGYIVLQDHGDPVWYRNIRVLKLGG